jgi:NAD(P)-dependent dehydrogenase (short-subunit alcohol dehydrogenase family)
VVTEPRRALVTGAAGGIGQAVVGELERRQMNVAGVDAEPGEAKDVVRCDVTDDDQVRDAVQHVVERLGGLEVVVNIVGISGRSLGDSPVDQCTEEAWDRVIEVNLKSVFLVCRATLGELGPGSSIVNVASVMGMRGSPPGIFDTHAYSASKGGVIALTRAMAATYAPKQIRVNAVAPGLVRTPMSSRAQSDPDVLSFTAARQAAVGSLLDPEQVAAAVGFLASTDSNAITGVVLPVDGGWTAT